MTMTFDDDDYDDSMTTTMTFDDDDGFGGEKRWSRQGEEGSNGER